MRWDWRCWYWTRSDIERRRLQRGMRMYATDVDLQLAELCVDQRARRQNALDGLLEHAIGMGLQNLFERGRTDAARILGMPVVNLVLELVAGRLHLLGIDDDDVIARVDVRGVFRLVLAAQAVGNFSGQTAERFVRRVNHVPVALDEIGSANV